MVQRSKAAALTVAAAALVLLLLLAAAAVYRRSTGGTGPGALVSPSVATVLPPDAPVPVYTLYSGSAQLNGEGNPFDSIGGRAHHATALVGDALYVFGGADGSGGGSGYYTLSELWAYNLTRGVSAYNSGSPGTGGGWVRVADGLATGPSYGYPPQLSAPQHPGSRRDHALLADNSNIAQPRLWLFGGVADNVNAVGKRQDLWQFDIHAGVWTGVGPSNSLGTYDAPGTYVASGCVPGQWPPARSSAAAVFDAPRQRVWVYGGVTKNAAASGAGDWSWDDLWAYDIVNGVWCWLGGSKADGTTDPRPPSYNSSQPNTYGPGARSGAALALDARGDLWLYGGAAYVGAGAPKAYADLWTYQPVTSAWVWRGGTPAPNQPPLAGPRGLYQADPPGPNRPGALMDHAMVFVQSMGLDTLVLFGGSDVSRVSLYAFAWSYDIASGAWAQLNPFSGQNTAGVYPYPDGTNPPTPVHVSSRALFGGSVVRGGEVFVFGGIGYGDNTTAGAGNLADLWSFQPDRCAQNLLAGWYCAHGGTCVNSYAGPQCVCPPSWLPPNCTIAAPPPPTTASSSTGAASSSTGGSGATQSSSTGGGSGGSSGSSGSGGGGGGSNPSGSSSGGAGPNGGGSGSSTGGGSGSGSGNPPTPPDPCAHSQCAPHAACQPTSGIDYRCACPTGWTGGFCDVPPPPVAVLSAPAVMTAGGCAPLVLSASASQGQQLPLAFVWRQSYAQPWPAPITEFPVSGAFAMPTPQTPYNASEYGAYATVNGDTVVIHPLQLPQVAGTAVLVQLTVVDAHGVASLPVTATVNFVAPASSGAALPSGVSFRIAAPVRDDGLLSRAAATVITAALSAPATCTVTSGQQAAAASVSYTFLWAQIGGAPLNLTTVDLTRTSLSLPAGVLNAGGGYQFSLTVRSSAALSGNSLTVNSPRYSVSAGAAIVAAISGGALYTIPADQPLTLDASSSYDPDGDTALSYAWACVDTGTGGATVWSGATPVLSKVNLVIAANLLSAGSTQSCSVSVSAYGKPLVTSSAVFIAVGAPVGQGASALPPAVSIQGAAYRTANADQVLRLTGLVTLSVGRSAAYAWTETAQSLRLDDTVVQSPVTGLGLAVRANVLLPGATYRFRLTASDKVTRVSSAAEVSVYVNAPPQAATPMGLQAIRVTPLVGSVDTVFHMSCPPFVDPAGGLQYQFLIRPSGGADDGSDDIVLGNGWQSSPTLDTRLPVVGTDLTVVTKIGNALGAVVAVASTVSVQPTVSATLAPGQTDAVDATLSFAWNQTAVVLPAALALQDTAGACAAIDTAAGIVNSAAVNGSAYADTRVRIRDSIVDGLSSLSAALFDDSASSFTDSAFGPRLAASLARATAVSTEVSPHAAAVSAQLLVLVLHDCSSKLALARGSAGAVAAFAASAAQTPEQANAVASSAVALLSNILAPAVQAAAASSSSNGALITSGSALGSGLNATAVLAKACALLPDVQQLLRAALSMQLSSAVPGEAPATLSARMIHARAQRTYTATATSVSVDDSSNSASNSGSGGATGAAFTFPALPSATYGEVLDLTVTALDPSLAACRSTAGASAMVTHNVTDDSGTTAPDAGAVVLYAQVSSIVSAEAVDVYGAVQHISGLGADSLVTLTLTTAAGGVGADSVAAQVLAGSSLACAFWDTTALTWSSAGCVTRAVNAVANRTGVFAVDCACNHLTDFVLLLRTDQRLQSGDATQPSAADELAAASTYFSFTALYLAVALFSAAQCGRLFQASRCHKAHRGTLGTHALVCLCALLRAASMVSYAQASHMPFATVVILAGLPYAVLFPLHTFLIFAWAGIYHFAVNHVGSDPFQRVKPLFVASNTLVVTVVFGLFAAFGVPSLAVASKTVIATAGSVVIALMFILQSVGFIVYGTLLCRQLSSDFPPSQHARRIFGVGVAASACFVVESVALLYAVLGDGANMSTSAFVSSTALFFGAEVVGIAAVLALFVRSVNDAVDSSDKYVVPTRDKSSVSGPRANPKLNRSPQPTKDAAAGGGAGGAGQRWRPPLSSTGTPVTGTGTSSTTAKATKDSPELAPRLPTSAGHTRVHSGAPSAAPSAARGLRGIEMAAARPGAGVSRAGAHSSVRAVMRPAQASVGGGDDHKHDGGPDGDDGVSIVAPAIVVTPATEPAPARSSPPRMGRRMAPSSQSHAMDAAIAAAAAAAGPGALVAAAPAPYSSPRAAAAGGGAAASSGATSVSGLPQRMFTVSQRAGARGNSDTLRSASSYDVENI